MTHVFLSVRWSECLIEQCDHVIQEEADDLISMIFKNTIKHSLLEVQLMLWP